MAEYAVTITYSLDNGLTYQTAVLDTVNDVQVTTSSEITTHPIVTGDLVADHMIRQPSTMTISGNFSMNGSKAFVVDNDGAKLTNIQTLFETINKEGILCSIVKVSIEGGINTESKSKARFLQRNSMALTNIQWTEQINSMGYNFTFTEVITIEVQEYDVDISDSYLPDINEPVSLNFTEALLDWNDIDTRVTQALSEVNLITQDFLSYLSSLTATSLVAIGVATAIALTIVSICGAIGPAGWIIVAIGAAVAVVVGIVNWIKKTVNSRKYKIAQFQKYKDDRKNQQEVQRFSNFVGELHQELTELNTALKVYQLSSSGAQECLVTIDNNLYVFTFTKNNTTNSYDLKITDVDYQDVGNGTKNVKSAFSSLSDCTDDNYLFRSAEYGSRVYLLKNTENEDFDENDLTNYYIFVSSIKMSEYNNTIQKIIINSFTY